MSYTLITYCTPECVELARHMAATAVNVGIERVKIYERATTGTWEGNIGYKAGVLLEAIGELDTDIVYVDSDATFNYYPAMFDNLAALGYDFAAHWRDNTELLGGTLWLRNIPKMILWLNTIKGTQEQTGEWTQKIMGYSVIDWFSSNHVYRLPPEYCCISDTMRARYPGLAPVIEHHQASRKVRRYGLKTFTACDAYSGDMR